MSSARDAAGSHRARSPHKVAPDRAAPEATGGPPDRARPLAHSTAPDRTWTADHAFELFQARTNLEKGGAPHLRDYRLDRMEEILRRLGSPHRHIPAVHVAGSKGKGSTAAFTAHLIAAGGNTVGLYTSPHVMDYRERFTLLNCESNREALLVRESRAVWGIVEEMQREGVPREDLPTTFELLTALAFRLFAAARCDIAVLEVGLGGRLDATNVCRPVLTMITRIELEHQEYLGNTLPRIAREKGGIIKPGVAVILAPQRSPVRRVLRSIARRQGAPILPMKPFPGLPERVRRTNAGHAHAAWMELCRSGRVAPAPHAVVRVVLERTSLPGRGELLGDLFLDGAHTPESVTHAVRAVRAVSAAEGKTSGKRSGGPRSGSRRSGGRRSGSRRSGGRRSSGTARSLKVIILGVVSGKDIQGIARALRGHVDRVIVSRPGTFKPGDPEKVYAAVTEAGIPTELHPDPDDALRRARELNAGTPILVTGSFYMVGEIRRRVIETIPSAEDSLCH